eukprot:3781873-Rhodomonas_salina.1
MSVSLAIFLRVRRFAPTCPLPEEGGRWGSGGKRLEALGKTQICTVIPLYRCTLRIIAAAE